MDGDCDTLKYFTHNEKENKMSYSRHLPEYQTTGERNKTSSEIASYTQSGYKDSYQGGLINDGFQYADKVYPTSSKVRTAVESHGNRGKKELKHYRKHDNLNSYAGTNIHDSREEISEQDFYSKPKEQYVKSSKQQLHYVDKDLQAKQFHDESLIHNKEYLRKPSEYHGYNRHMGDSDIFSHTNAEQTGFDLSRMHSGNKYENFRDENRVSIEKYQSHQYKQPSPQFLEMKQYSRFSESTKKYPVESDCKSEKGSDSHRPLRNISYGQNKKILQRDCNESENRFCSERNSSNVIHLDMGVKTKMFCDRRNKSFEDFSKDDLEQLSSDEEFQSLSRMVHHKYSTGKSITMKDARKIARNISTKLHQRNEVFSENRNQQNFNSEGRNYQTSNTRSVSCELSDTRKRIKWAKQNLNDKSYSGKVKRNSSINRKNLFLENALPGKGKGAWRVKRAKAKGRIKESFKDFFSKLQVWSSSLKFIEGHFGTSVVSYFVFLRWLLFLNLYIFVIFLVFIVLPQVYFPVLQQRKNITTAPTTELFDTTFISQFPTSKKSSAEYMPRVSTKSYQDLGILISKGGLDDDYLKHFGSQLDTYVVPDFLDATLYYGRTNYTAEKRHNVSEYCYKHYVDLVGQNTLYDIASVIQDFFQGTGWMELTLMFTGHYLPTDLLVSGTGLYYNLSVAFLSVLLVLYIMCLVMMINYASKGVRETLLSAEGGVQSYSNMVFCGWDYCIESSRTATLKHNSILLELKSSLAEAKRQEDIAQWTTLHKAKVYCIRFIVNIFVIATLVGTYYLIYYVAEIQLKEQRNPQNVGFSELLIQFLPSITITTVNFIMPFIFDIIVRYESYGIQAALNITLVRIIFVRLASIIILVITFYRQITCEPKNLCGIGMQRCPSPICWETHVGQQMYRLVLMDFFVVIAVTFVLEVPRNFVVRRWKCKLTDMIGRQTFDVPSQVLAIVYAQTLCWLGVFYSPLLPAVCVLKIIILFYLKKFTLLVNCVPSQISYRASRSNAVFVIVLMLNFFITVAILGYSISNIVPSPGCSPFRHLDFMIDAIKEALNTWSPNFTLILKYIFSTGFAMCVIVVLCLAIYYYLTVTAAHKRMIKVLKSQLVLEGRDKQFLLSRLTEVACQGFAKENQYLQ